MTHQIRLIVSDQLHAALAEIAREWDKDDQSADAMALQLLEGSTRRVAKDIIQLLARNDLDPTEIVPALCHVSKYDEEGIERGPAREDGRGLEGRAGERYESRLLGSPVSTSIPAPRFLALG